jgi:hypothetical protein
MRIGICNKCFFNRRLERHHILPRRFFGKNKYTVVLCEDCHDEIEGILPIDVKLSKGMYLEINEAWLRGKALPIAA